MTQRSIDRHRLNREHVIAAAIDLADEQGSAALSMRSLSAQLGVVPMALYKHVGGKDDLIAGMLDVVIAGYPAPPPTLTGTAAVRARVLVARSALAEHPWLRAEIEQATTHTPAVLAYMNAIAGDLAAAGLSYDLIHYGMHALGHRIWGFNPEAFSGARSAAAPAPELVAYMTANYPHVSAIADDSARRNPAGSCDEEFEFEFTLDLMLESIDRLHATSWVSRSMD
ncbi:MAG: TetR/AcrR family transcriptional regulator [Rhodoglobus sp.]